MVHIAEKDIRGYFVEEGSKQLLVCPECLGSEEKENLEQHDLLTRDGMNEKDNYFCDRCGKAISF